MGLVRGIRPTLVKAGAPRRTQRPPPDATWPRSNTSSSRPPDPPLAALETLLSSAGLRAADPDSRGELMSSIDTTPSPNGRVSPSWSQPRTHLSLDRGSPGYCRVRFEHPPINTITATTVVELAELAGLIEEDPDLNVVVFDGANPDFYLATTTPSTTRRGLPLWGWVRPGCMRGSMSWCACPAHRWSASPRHADAPGGLGASSSSPATCASPRARTRWSANRRSA